MNKKRPLSAFIPALIIFIFFQCFFYDIYNIADARSFGLGIVVGFFYYLLHIFYLLVIIFALSFALGNFKAIKWRAFLPITTCLIIVLLFYVFPTTDLYVDLNYHMNKRNRIKTIEMIENNEMYGYAIGSNEYLAPFRHISRTGTLDAYKIGKTRKVVFSAHRGIIISKNIVYVSDDSGVSENDFGTYKHKQYIVKRLSQNWYSVTIEH